MSKLPTYKPSLRMIARIIALVLGAIVVVATLLPLIRHDQWWIRIFDFPRLQILVLSAVSLAMLGFLTRVSASWLNIVAIVLVAASAAYQLAAIYPYTILSRKQVEPAQTDAAAPTLRIMVANVLMSNDRYQGLLDAVETYTPDLLLTVETNAAWEARLRSLHEEYPYIVSRPLDNTYGMILYSRIELESEQVRYLMEPDVPSIHAYIRLKNGVRVRLYLVHPKPPFPKEAIETTERDAELLLVGRQVSERDEPAIVAGDLNDVAWSYTTRLFQRISRMLDPRIGRGMYNTFHAGNPLMRWPLDHIFHTSHFKLVRLQRLPNIGSDHFPMYVELAFDYDGPSDQEVPEPEEGDQEEATEAIREGRSDD